MKSAIRCTQKLLAQIGPEKRIDEAASPESPWDWYANLLWIERRKCVLFTNAGTLYCFLSPDVRAKEIRSLPALFRSHLCDNLTYEGFSPVVIEKRWIGMRI